MDLLNISNIKKLCKDLDIHPNKSKGQNFLIDKNVLEDIIKTANLKQNDVVLEIGPGFGVLTFELAKLVKSVIAVELDRKLVSYLRKEFQRVANFELIEGDFISLFNCFPSGIQSLASQGAGDQGAGASPARTFGEYKVVANLPYQITSRILRILLEAKNKPKEIIVMVQKEVGERICAKPGEMSMLSVMCQFYGKPSIVRIVSKKSFWPVPKVDSVILKIRIMNYESRIMSKDELFFKIVKIGFSSRRKMLRKNLGNVIDQQKVDKVMTEIGLDLKARAQELSVEQWINLVQNFQFPSSNFQIISSNQFPN